MAEMLNIRKLKQIQAKMKSRSAQAIRKLSIGLYRAGLHLRRASQKIVPVKLGNLKNSAFTSPAEVVGTRVSVRVGYTANYALYVHENLDARHKPGKQAKFLEGPMREEAAAMQEILKESMK